MGVERTRAVPNTQEAVAPGRGEGGRPDLECPSLLADTATDAGLSGSTPSFAVGASCTIRRLVRLLLVNPS